MLNNKKRFIKTGLTLIVGLSAFQAQAATYVDILDPDVYGRIGTITFDDWGFVGPAGRTAMDFEPDNGFDFNSIGQK